MKAHRTTILATITAFCLSGFAFGDDAAKTISPDAARARLKARNQRYASAKITAGKPTATRRAETAQSQHPFAIVVGCADSRTSPEIVFDQNIGDLFVVRTAGNLVAEHALGSIEYAVEHLGRA